MIENDKQLAKAKEALQIYEEEVRQLPKFREVWKKVLKNLADETRAEIAEYERQHDPRSPEGAG